MLKIDSKKIKIVSIQRILHEIDLIDEEFKDYNISWARTKELSNYRNELLNEIKRRKSIV